MSAAMTSAIIEGVFTVASFSESQSEFQEIKPYSHLGAVSSTLATKHRERSMVQRQPTHAVSDSEESDDSVTCISMVSPNVSPATCNTDVSAPFSQHRDTMGTDQSPYTFLSSSNVSQQSQSSLNDDCTFMDDNLKETMDTEETAPVPEKAEEEALPDMSDVFKASGILEKASKLKALGTKRSRITTRVKDTAKSEKALQRLLEREKKQKEKLLTKALKDLEKEAKRSAKPEECLKSMKLSVDDQLAEMPDFGTFLNVLHESELPYSFEKNHIPLSVVWYRHVSEVDFVDNELQKRERDDLESVLLLYVPDMLFVDMVYATVQKMKDRPTAQQTLMEYVTKIKTVFPKMDITLVTIGLHNCLKGKRKNRDNEGVEWEKGSTKNISKKDVDEVIIQTQLQLFLNYKSLDNSTEFGNLLVRYTKAVAEAPFKKEKYQMQQQFSWYAQADSSRPVKIGKNGDGYVALWQQQIQQFNSIGKDIAQAIAAHYSSPLLLIEAYSKCTSEKEAEKLLQDIVVRRDYGPLGTTRRVGPELSHKIFLFLTSTNGSEFLKR